MRCLRLTLHFGPFVSLPEQDKAGHRYSLSDSVYQQVVLQ